MVQPLSRPPDLHDRFARGDAFAAAWLTLGAPFAAEVAARAGFDVVVHDMQHGLADRASLLGLLQATQGVGCPSMVRVPANDASIVTAALDMGADGVIVPLVEGPEDAAAAVAACRFPPEGRRSYGAFRASARFGSPGAAARNAAVFAMVETRGALERLDAICATPGLTGVFVGPADLGLSMGIGPQTDGDHPDFRAALDAIAAGASRHAIACGIYSDDPEFGRRCAQRGMQLVVVATDAKLLAGGAAERLRAFRG